MCYNFLNDYIAYYYAPRRIVKGIDLACMPIGISHHRWAYFCGRKRVTSPSVIARGEAPKQSRFWDRTV